jgi:hypothetical protein
LSGVDRPPRAGSLVIECDVSALCAPNWRAIDLLARLELVARRSGATLRLRNAPADLVELIAFAGLAGVLVVAGADGSAVEVQRQAEPGEQRGVDEEVLRGDRPT